MENNDKLEQVIRDLLNDHEAEYDPAAWARMETALEAAAVGSAATSLSAKTGLLAAAGAVLVGGGIFLYSLFSDEETPLPLTEDGPIAEQTNAQQDKAQSSTGTASEAETASYAEAAEELAAKQDAADAANAEDAATPPTDNSNNSDALADAAPNPIPGAEIAAISTFDVPDLQQGKHICPNVPVAFSSHNNAPATYFWQFGDGNTSRDKNPRHSYATPGTYDVTLTVKHNVTGKVVTSTMNELVTVKPGIKAEWSWKEGNPLIHDPSLQWAVESPDAVAWTWKFDNERETTERSPVHMFVEQGSHQVELVVENRFQCADTIRKPVVMQRDYDLFAAKSFSPNGDGVNDTWIPLALKLSEHRFVLNIVDAKTGAIVFTSTDPSKPWNGTHKGTNAKAAAGEVYYWVAELEGYSGKMNEFAGMVTITE